MGTRTHMYAVKLLSAMVDDLTIYIIKMPLDIALVLERGGRQDECQRGDW